MANFFTLHKASNGYLVPATGTGGLIVVNELVAVLDVIDSLEGVIISDEELIGTIIEEEIEGEIDD